MHCFGFRRKLAESYDKSSGADKYTYHPKMSIQNQMEVIACYKYYLFHTDFHFVNQKVESNHEGCTTQKQTWHTSYRCSSPLLRFNSWKQ